MGSFSQGIPNPTATHIGTFSPVDWPMPLEKTNGKTGPMRRARRVALEKSWCHTSRDAELQRAVTWNVHSSTRVQIRAGSSDLI